MHEVTKASVRMRGLIAFMAGFDAPLQIFSLLVAHLARILAESVPVCSTIILPLAADTHRTRFAAALLYSESRITPIAARCDCPQRYSP
ncbi:MAG: hypothetical protein JNL32_08345 [Candidatus Kapabacteria bacterium]|nr:hypothetical protein [Candidatus Kapabacteria bacterium]